ncbi:Flp pilus assembly protein CpaB [Pelagibaculum spongiae]|uniref:Flp pilus assembly protein CpaB n=1 Tax=Pelagibaculum spongiae TaxID=2080658 RepID=A0A2V1GS30_9GAMM|nr:Flp pilus assembly protein CpaB [Pelagibaculum spongiae]PVZ68199.1 Flp pilus assembly protein CpaB [Pelagibaculum spongiae]
MEKLKPLAMLLVAVLLAGVATWSGTSYLRQKENSLRAELEAEKRPMKVLVASRDLVAGDHLSSDTLQVRKIPTEFVPDGALTPADFDYVRGLMLSEPVSFGKPLMRHFIRGVSGVGSFSELLEKGQRAITLEVDNLSSIEGLIQTGDYIDLALVTAGSKKQSASFNHLLDKVLVLATGKQTIADAGMTDTSGNSQQGDYRSITLGLNMRDIPRVSLANENGELRFLLRNPEDQAKGRYPDQRADSSFAVVESFVGGKAENGVLKSSGQAIRTMPSREWQQQLVDSSRQYQKFQNNTATPGTGLISSRHQQTHNTLPLVRAKTIKTNTENKEPNSSSNNSSPLETALNAKSVQGSDDS